MKQPTIVSGNLNDYEPILQLVGKLRIERNFWLPRDGRYWLKKYLRRLARKKEFDIAEIGSEGRSSGGLFGGDDHYHAEVRLYCLKKELFSEETPYRSPHYQNCLNDLEKYISFMQMPCEEY